MHNKRDSATHRVVIGETMFDLLWHKIYNSIIWLHFRLSNKQFGGFFQKPYTFSFYFPSPVLIFSFFCICCREQFQCGYKKNTGNRRKKLFAKFHRNTQFSATNYTLHLLVIKQIFNHDVFEYKKLVFVRIDKHTYIQMQYIHMYIAQQQSNWACSFCLLLFFSHC